MKAVTLHVAGGLAELRFGVSSTGPDGSDTSPGIGFEVIHSTLPFSHDGKFVGGTGVISRYDAARLLALLASFLAEYPPRSTSPNPPDAWPVSL